VQCSGIEYEFTWVIDMTHQHTAVVSKSRAADLADLVKNEPGVEWFRQFYDWLVVGKEPNRTKQELINFGDSIGLKPEDICKALADAGIEWDPDPQRWNDITKAASKFAEQLETAEV
jgi:hypothetical protein